MDRSGDRELSAEQSGAVARRVREALARRRISRQRLADDARLSLSTLEKALAGARPFTLATLIRLEEALGVSLREAPPPAPAPPPANGQAPDELGAYTRKAVAWLIGDYLTLRPSFGNPSAVYAYRTEISWDEAASRLVFQEAARLDAAFSQRGEVSLSNQSGHIHLVTNYQGQYRLITLGRPTIAGALYGVLATLQAGRGGQLTPVASTIALLPLRGMTAEPAFGQIGPGHGAYGDYRGHMERVVGEDFVRLLGA